LPLFFHRFDRPITTALFLQATLTNDLQPCDELPFVRENDLIGGSLEFASGHFVVPSGNGLGIALDDDAIAHYRTGQ
jgi:L-alanine-DL-glutamate epimerase-like enolase superfamily enzyme